MPGISKRSKEALDRLAVPDEQAGGRGLAGLRKGVLVLVGTLVMTGLAVTLYWTSGWNLASWIGGAPSAGREDAGELTEAELQAIRRRLETEPSLVAVAHADSGSIVAYDGVGPDAEEIHRFEYDSAHPEHFLAVRTFDDINHLEDGRLEVYLPVRPNGTTGWIDLDGLTLSEHLYRVEVDTGEHRVRVFNGPEQVIESPIGVGTGATPTPLGFFFTSQLFVIPDPTGPYGPFAFGLSGYSESIFDFNGGDGIIGLHGTDDPSALGTDVSHGCIRIHNDVISRLATTIPLGTPVLITD